MSPSQYDMNVYQTQTILANKITQNIIPAG